MINTSNDITLSKRKFGMRDKIGYLLGDVGSELFFDISTAFLMVYYTDVFGLNPMIVGSIFVVARLWDAFMDVAAGRFIDARRPTKEGKFKPWLLRFCPVYAVTGILMFTKIPGLSDNEYLLYAVVTYIAWGTAFSFINVPFGSMASVITTDSNERTALSTFRSIGAYIAQMAIKTLVPAIAFLDNKPDADRFFLVAVVSGVMGIITYFGFYKLSTERVIIDKSSDKKGNLLNSVKALGKNRPLHALLAGALIFLLALMATSSLNAYLFKDYFKNTSALALSGSIIILNVIFVAPMVGPVVKKFGKKEAASIAILFTTVAYFLLYLIPITNGYIFVGCKWIADIGVTFFNFIIWAFITDAIDYQELISGRREDGTVFSIYTFARKLGQSFSGGVAGLVLGIAGYVKAPQQTAEVAEKIRDLALLIPGGLYFIVFLCIAFWYPMNKEKVAQVAEKLAEKRSLK